jgi:hypothetical protein
MPKIWALAWPDIWYRGTGNTIAQNGTHYGMAELTADVCNAYKAKGITLFRVGFTWTNMQPTLGGPIDATHAERMKYSARAAAANGCKIIVDLHSVGSQRSGNYISQNGAVTYAQLRDFWAKLTTVLKADAAAWAGIWALEIMNEPGQTDGSWLGNHTVAGSGYRAGLQGVRDVDATMRVIISGEGYTNCSSWGSVPGNNNITTGGDPNVIIAGHQYFDAGYSGNYRADRNDVTIQPNPTSPSNEGMTASAATARMQPWLDFLTAKGYNGMVTEFGVPCANGTDTSWLAILSAVMQKLDSHPRVVGGSTWTGGGPGLGDSGSWPYNGSQGIPPYDSPGGPGPNNVHWQVLGQYPTGDLAAGSGGGGGGTPPPTSSGLSIFTEQYDNGFAENGSWSTTAAPATPSPAYQGANALGITYNAQFGAYVVRRAASFPSTDYANLTLAIYSPNARSVGVSLIDSAGNGLWGSKQILSVPAGVWTPYTVSMATLAANATVQVSGIAISDQSPDGTTFPQPAMYLDAASFGLLPQALTGAGVALPPVSGVGVTDLPPKLTSLSVFSEQFDNGFVENGSFGSASGTPSNPSVLYEGVSALAVNFGAAFGAYLLRRPATFSSANFSVLHLAVYSPNARQIGVSLIDDAGVGLYGNKIILSVPASAWTVFDLKISDLTGNTPRLLSGLAISDQSPTGTTFPQPTMYVDALRFISLGLVGSGPTVSPVVGQGVMGLGPVGLVGAGQSQAPVAGVGQTAAPLRTAGVGAAIAPAAGVPTTAVGVAAMIGVGQPIPVAVGQGVTSQPGATKQVTSGIGVNLAPNAGAGSIAVSSVATTGVGQALTPAAGLGSISGLVSLNGSGVAKPPAAGVGASAVAPAAMTGVGQPLPIGIGTGLTSTGEPPAPLNVYGEGAVIDVAVGLGSTNLGTPGVSGGVVLLDAATIAKLDAIKAKTDQIGTGAVLVSAPVASNNDVTVYQGTDYADADGRALEWTAAAGAWPSNLTGATVTMTVQNSANRTVLTIPVTVVTPTGAQRLRAELTAVHTNLASTVYLYLIRAVLPSTGHTVPLVAGRFTVKKVGS